MNSEKDSSWISQALPPGNTRDTCIAQQQSVQYSNQSYSLASMNSEKDSSWISQALPPGNTRDTCIAQQQSIQNSSQFYSLAPMNSETYSSWISQAHPPVFTEVPYFPHNLNCKTQLSSTVPQETMTNGYRTDTYQ